MSFCCSTPFLLALVFSTAFCSSRWLALLWLAAGVHELGHLLALHLMGVRVKRICFRLSGMELQFDGRRLSYGQEALLALAGPGANLLLCLLTAALRPSLWQMLLCGCSLTIGGFNLLPALPLDGGRALRAMLLRRWPERGERILWGSSAVCGLALAAAGIYFGRTQGNLSLLAAGCAIFSVLPGKRLYTRRKNRYNKDSSER